VNWLTELSAIMAQLATAIPAEDSTTSYGVMGVSQAALQQKYGVDPIAAFDAFSNGIFVGATGAGGHKVGIAFTTTSKRLVDQ
jgi:hypothetical protein